MLVSNRSEDKATGIYSGLSVRAWWQLLQTVSEAAVVPQKCWILTLIQLVVFTKDPLSPHTNTIKKFKNHLTVNDLLLNSYAVVNCII